MNFLGARSKRKAQRSATEPPGGSPHSPVGASVPTGEREDKGRLKREFREKLDLKEKEKERLREQLRSTSNEKLDVMLGKRKGAPPKAGTPLHSAFPVWSSEVAATAATSFLAPKETPRGVHLTKKESKRFKLVLEQYPSLIDGKCKYLVSPLG